MTNLSELGGPTSVIVDADIGQQGVRGSNIFESTGDPNVPGNIIGTPQEYDIAVNIKVDDEGYLFLYYFELITIPGDPPTTQLAWVPKFRLVPNSISQNKNVEFINGEATASISAPVPPNISIDPANPEENIDLQYNIANRIDLNTNVQNPFSSYFEITDVVENNGIATITFVFNAIELSGGTWTPVTGEKTLHLVITVV